MTTQSNWLSSELIKIWPQVGLAAIRARLGGEFRVWSISKHLDKPGSGCIYRCELDSYCNSLDINARTLRRWKMGAVNIGILKKVFRRKTQKEAYILTGLSVGAHSFGSNRIGRPASVPGNSLVGNRWRSWIWVAFLSTCVGRPISRAVMREITGVPEQTQRDYERRAGIPIIPNFAVTNISGDHLDGFREFERSYAFKFLDKKTNGEVIAFQLPNTYETPSYINTLPKGRSGKAQKELNAALCIVEQGQSIEILRLYHETPRSANTSLRRIGRIDSLNRPESIYLRRHSGDSVTWCELSRDS